MPADTRAVAPVELVWRDPESVEVRLANDPRGLVPLTAELQAAHAAGARYAVAHVALDDRDAIACLLRSGFEPELAGPGHEAAWDALLEQESGSRRLL